MKAQLQDLLQKEMTRREFLATLGFGAASLLGFSSLIKMLEGRNSGRGSSASYGYGSNGYGR